MTHAVPAHLSPAATAFYSHVLARGLCSEAARPLLVRFCEVRDLLTDIQRQRSMSIGSFTTTGKHGYPRLHPLVKRERILGKQYRKLFRLLGWDQTRSRTENSTPERNIDGD